MKAFRVLTIASGIATFLLIAIGGLVRATKSGLGCGTDWPDCGGRLIPALATRAEVIEFSHRAAAGLVVLLLAATVAAAIRGRVERRLARAAGLALGLVLWQAVLGAIVVKLELESESVVLHLATALALLGVLVYLIAGVRRGATGVAARPTVARAARLGAAAVLALLLVGSYLSGIGAEQGAGFPEWPLIEGRIVPDLGTATTALHFLHRALALAAGAVVAYAAVVAWRARADSPAAARLTGIAAVAFAGEVLVGAANVWTQDNAGVNSAFVTVHLALGALIWACLVGAAVVTSGAFAHRQQRAAAPGAQRMLEPTAG